MSSSLTEAHDQTPDLDDDFLWLEDIHGDDPLDWVREENETTLARFRDDLFDRMSAEILTALDSDDRIPMVTKRGGHLYNFWRDKDHPKGLWRRTTWDRREREESTSCAARLMGIVPSASRLTSSAPST